MRVSLIMILTLRFLSRLPQKPASLQAKKVKMKVGQQIKLSDYLEYKDEKKKETPKLPFLRREEISKENDRNGEASGYED